MTTTPANLAAVTTPYPQELLDDIDTAAHQAQISRDQWLVRAARRALPYQTLRASGAGRLRAVVRELDNVLDGRRGDALNTGLEQHERIPAGIGYHHLSYEMLKLINELMDRIPRQEASDGYEAAEATAPESPDTIKAWARTAACEDLLGILDAVRGMLPLDGSNVEDRAQMENPNAMLD
ncbi:hypothetical protein [Streptomyces sp. CAU 1734]|uniref:hypothetical protein n=1 Tax=Streptomyces sp. CAU 1734 TaxID=3140360 RepID=UPI00326101BC